MVSLGMDLNVSKFHLVLSNTVNSLNLKYYLDYRLPSFGTCMIPEHVSKSSHDSDSIKFTEINSQLPLIFSRAGISSSAR